MERHLTPYLRLIGEDGPLSGEERKLVLFLKRRGKARQEDVAAAIGKRRLQSLLPSLLSRGIVLRTLEFEGKRKGIITIREEAAAGGVRRPAAQPALGPEELAVCEAVRESLRAPDGGRSFLLFGGSRERVYLHLIDSALAQGGQVLFLTPAFASGAVGLLRERFPGAVAALHRRLTSERRCEIWLGIRNGLYSVIVGQRNAVFAPLPRPGLIILDGEEEQAYKGDRPPYYHAREVALALGRLTGATVVLGSAVPDVGSFFRAERGEIRLLELPPGERPEVEVVDLRRELKEGNYGFLSRRLREAARERAQKGGRVILFLNRKGAAPLVKCRSCGFVLYCRSCDIPLNYHSMEDMLLCHRCHYRTPLPPSCPGCGRAELRLLGVGIERVREEVLSFLPEEQIAFYEGDGRDTGERPPSGVRVALGTGAVAAADFPGAELVGIVNADTLLHLPDFRAAEKTFQMLHHIMAKAGGGGKVILQTYSPDHYAIKAAARLDYLALYRTEIESRRRLNYPPFSPLARLLYRHPSPEYCRREAERLAERLREERRRRGLEVEVKGPTPAFIARIKGLYRWQLVLQGRQVRELLSGAPPPPGWLIDIEPYDLL